MQIETFRQQGKKSWGYIVPAHSRKEDHNADCRRRRRRQKQKKLLVFTLTKHTLYARFENYSQVIVCVCKHATLTTF